LQLPVVWLLADVGFQLDQVEHSMQKEKCVKCDQSEN
jgi:hypothetical protein